jgi:hypothetical protein
LADETDGTHRLVPIGLSDDKLLARYGSPAHRIARLDRETMAHILNLFCRRFWHSIGAALIEDRETGTVVPATLQWGGSNE